MSALHARSILGSLALVATLGTLAALGCSSSSGGPNGSSTTGSTPHGHVDAALVGNWYAGRGGTTVPYDPTTGSWGTPSGQGLVYNVAADGTYVKAYQSYNSAGGCTNGFTAFESGWVESDASSFTLTLHATSGHVKVSDTCAPSLDSDKPSTDLRVQTFTFGWEGDALTLTDENGASAAFRRL